MLGELTSKEIEQVLSDNVIARIGCYADGRVYVVPVTYIYDEGCAIGHTSEGLKIHMLRENPACCFEVDQYENLANWKSVIALGNFEELQGDEATAAMQKLVKKLMPLMASQTSQPSHGLEQTHRHDISGKQAIIYKIKLLKKSGRFEKR